MSRLLNPLLFSALRCTVPYESIEPIVLPLPKTRCLLINGTPLAQATTQTAVRLRRLKSSRMSEKAVTLREITDKLQNSIPKLQNTVDLNNNSQCTNNNSTAQSVTPIACNFLHLLLTVMSHRW